MSATYDFDCECDNFEMLEDQDVFTMNEGIPGPGVPAGGSTGQILQKRSQEDYDTEWITPDGYVPAGGSAGQILKKSSAADYDTEWDSLDAGDVSFDSSLTYAAGSVGKEICDVKNTLSLLDDEIPDTVQTITFDQNGNVQSITHSRNNVAVRTDVFTFAANSVTEVRTLSTGQSLTIVTNLSTLETTITYSEGGN